MKEYSIMAVSTNLYITKLCVCGKTYTPGDGSTCDYYQTLGKQDIRGSKSQVGTTYTVPVSKIQERTWFR